MEKKSRISKMLFGAGSSASTNRSLKHSHSPASSSPTKSSDPDNMNNSLAWQFFEENQDMAEAYGAVISTEIPQKLILNPKPLAQVDQLPVSSSPPNNNEPPLSQPTSRVRSRSIGTPQPRSPEKTTRPQTAAPPTLNTRKSIGTKPISPDTSTMPPLPRTAQTAPVVMSKGNVLRKSSTPPSVQKVDTSLNYMPSVSGKASVMKKKRGFFSSKPKQVGTETPLPSAWIAGGDRLIPYDIACLASGSVVPELWQETGNALVYLFPLSSGRGPSFRLSAEIFASSPALTALIHGDMYSIRAGSSMSLRSGSGVPFMIDPRTNKALISAPASTISAGVSPNTSYTDGSEDSREARGLVDQDTGLIHIRLPIAMTDPDGYKMGPNDFKNLVSVRNLFAFLVGQSLIATPAYPTVYDVFVQIGKHLEEFEFSNMDRSTFGETPDSSFTAYVHELHLLDMRNDAEKIIEGLLLGEKMRSALIWNEAFIHAAGMYDDLQRLCPAKFALLPGVAIQRLERAKMDLEKRIHRIEYSLTDFDFPGVFAGIMNSKMAEERGVAGFEEWRNSYQAARRFFLSHVKSKFGSWPPKKDKKSSFTLPQLNRRVLKIVEADINILYDLLVDRKHPSSRLVVRGKQVDLHHDRRIEALRKVLRECDESGSPVYPTMPFDAPLLPHASSGVKIDMKKKIGKVDLVTILNNSYNQDTKASRNAFINQWMAFEMKSTSGMTIDKVCNFRLGAWLFFYIVLQTLPMLTVDAPGSQFVENVDYFLCCPPRGRLPWSKESTQTEWFRDPVTGTLTQMSKEAMELTTEATYRLSHCWKASEIWEQQLPQLTGARMGSVRQPQEESPLPPPQIQIEMPPQIGGNIMDGWSAKSSPVILPQIQVPSYPQHQNSYPTPPLGPVYEKPFHHSTPNLHNLHTPPLQPIHEQHGSYPSPIITQGWDQFKSPGTPLTASPHSFTQPYLLNVSEPSLLPPPIITATPRSRNSSPYSTLGRRGGGGRESILMGGLERLPVPMPGPKTYQDRSSRAPSMTFEDIFKTAEPKSAPPMPRLPSRSGESVKSTKTLESKHRGRVPSRSSMWV